MPRTNRFLLFTIPLVPLCLAVLAAGPGKDMGTTYAFLLACGESDSGQLRRLPHAAKDLQELREVLLANGYAAANITLLCDGNADKRYLPERAKVLHELDTLLARIGPEDTLLVGYNGHAVKFRGDARGYWCPKDARLGDKKTLLPTTGEGGVFERLRKCKAKHKLLLVDASRKEPTKDVAAPKAVELEDRDEDEVPAGITALYSCTPGQKSHSYDPLRLEAEEREGSLFFQHILDAWERPEASEVGHLTVADLCYIVQWKTAGASSRLFHERQTPILRRDNKGDTSWVLCKRSEFLTKDEKVEAFEYEDKGKKFVGKRRVVTLDLGSGVKMELIRVHKGTFLLGVGHDETVRFPGDEQHSVQITRDFFLGKYEVTQEQYQQVTGKNPSAFSATGNQSGEVRGLDTRHLPVEKVSWEDAMEFCRKLTVAARWRHRRFRLPTEAEWEDACRGGSNDRFSFGDDAKLLGEYAWFKDNAGGRPQKVGTRKPNQFGLHDMHGNVQEWCLDWEGPLSDLPRTDPVRLRTAPDSGQHMVRGGNWHGSALFCTAGYRLALRDAGMYDDVGFRVAFSLD